MMIAQVLLDFDGTITLLDTVDTVLNRFAHPAWLAIEEEWTKGEIGSRECLGRQVALMRVTPEELDSLVDEIEVDPCFPAFMRNCEELRVAVTIVSDGFQRNIARVLDRIKIRCAFKASALVYLGNKRWRLDSPFALDACESAGNTCKCVIGREFAGPTIIVGDGMSDFCAAEKADFVFAKGKLAEQCQAARIPHAKIKNLSDAIKLLRPSLANLELPLLAAPILELETQ